MVFSSCLYSVDYYCWRLLHYLHLRHIHRYYYGPDPSDPIVDDDDSAHGGDGSKGGSSDDNGTSNGGGSDDDEGSSSSDDSNTSSDDTDDDDSGIYPGHVDVTPSPRHTDDDGVKDDDGGMKGSWNNVAGKNNDILKAYGGIEYRQSLQQPYSICALERRRFVVRRSKSTISKKRTIVLLSAGCRPRA